MPERTPEEIERAANAWLERRKHSRVTLADRMRDACRACLSSRVATTEQKRLARCVLSDLGTGTIPDAIQAGMGYELMRHAPDDGPAVTGRLRGTHWRGRWIELAPLLVKIANYLQDHAGPDGADLQNLVRECWGERYRPEYRTKYDKAISQLSRELVEADPPICVTFAVRSGRVFVDDYPNT